MAIAHPPARADVIRYICRRCALGWALIAVSGQGVCAILLGDAPEALEAELRTRFQKAQLVGSGNDSEPMTAALAFIELPREQPAFPIDARGTPFQRRVWDALRTIPPGQTASYSEIAQRIGAPTAIRAVACACAANPVAIAVPCHRVLRRDGALSGYRWGASRKSALLAREKVTLRV